MDRSPLGMLPPELRNQIWGLVLHVPDGIMLDIHTIPMNRKVPLALTHTCRQVYHETASLVFIANTFIINTCYFDAFDKDGKPEIPEVHGMAATATLARMVNVVGRQRIDNMQRLILCLGGDLYGLAEGDMCKFWEYAHEPPWGLFGHRSLLLPVKNLWVHMNPRVSLLRENDLHGTSSAVEYMFPYGYGVQKEEVRIRVENAYDLAEEDFDSRLERISNIPSKGATVHANVYAAILDDARWSDRSMFRCEHELK